MVEHSWRGQRFLDTFGDGPVVVVSVRWLIALNLSVLVKEWLARFWIHSFTSVLVASLLTGVGMFHSNSSRNNGGRNAVEGSRRPELAATPVLCRTGPSRIFHASFFNSCHVFLRKTLVTAQ